MMWSAIGCSVAGTSHTSGGKVCDDAIRYTTTTDANGDDVLLCCISDGAGSALYAAAAAAYTVATAVDELTKIAAHPEAITEADLYAIAETIYAGLELQAQEQGVQANEYSCTMLGCLIAKNRAAFFQIGDGAIVRNDGSGFYTAVWWPHNGEYQNSTAFVIDDAGFSHLNVLLLDEAVGEVALFTDGLQMLALNMEGYSAHQPFFADLFRFLKLATDNEKVGILNRKLEEYLDSPKINERTDDDKTLFLATRITQ